jgi:NAD(P)-dependent dehydrogenase (short-subunit alcohol dehydrogenase family)
MHDMRVAGWIDDLLEITVVGSFTSIGYRVRRAMFDWTAPREHVLEGRTVLVTGPTSGIGRAATLALAGLGARVVLAGRDPDRLSRLRDELIAAHGTDHFPAVTVDMASTASVRSGVRAVLDSESRLDVVVDNAGAIHRRRTMSPDGIEATLATMVVGPFALIAGLLPLLRATHGSRVISVTSGGQYAQALRLDDLQSTADPYDGTRAYARAKRAQVTLMREWARRESTVAFAAMHPGWADTPGVAEALPGFRRVMRPLLRTPAEGADTIVWLAAERAAEDVSGGLFLDRRRRPFDRVLGTRLSRPERHRLWDLVAGLAGIPDPLPDRMPGGTR